MSGKVAFFAPDMGIVPSSVCPPTILIRSIAVPLPNDPVSRGATAPLDCGKNRKMAVFRPQPSAVCLGFVALVAALRLGHRRRVRLVGAVTRLSLAAPEVVAKCRSQPLLPRRRMLCFGARRHPTGRALTSRSSNPPTSEHILARDTRHAKADS